MKFLVFQQDLKASHRMQAMLMVLCAVLIASNLLLTIFAMYQSRKVWTLVVPTVITQPFKFNKLQVDNNYLQQMSLFFLGERLNVTPETVDASYSLLLGYLSAEDYHDIDTVLSHEAKTIKEGKISSTFFANKIQVLPNKLTVNIDGTLSLWAGSQFISVEKKSYVLQYTYNNGRLLIKTFSEVSNEK